MAAAGPDGVVVPGTRYGGRVCSQRGLAAAGTAFGRGTGDARGGGARFDDAPERRKPPAPRRTLVGLPPEVVHRILARGGAGAAFAFGVCSRAAFRPALASPSSAPLWRALLADRYALDARACGPGAAWKAAYAACARTVALGAVSGEYPASARVVRADGGDEFWAALESITGPDIFKPLYLAQIEVVFHDS